MAGSPLQVLVVTPDEKSRAELRKGFQAHAGVRLVREFNDLAEAGALTKKRGVDAIFAVPSIGKDETLDWVDEVPRAVGVVLLAANARQAVHAFEKRVLDYLVAPVSQQRLRLTLDRLVEWKALHARPGREPRVEKKIVVQSRRESSVIRIFDIVCIRAEGNYTNLILSGGDHKLVHRSLRQWRRLLPEGTFFQIHRSTLINLNQVRHLERNEEGKSFLHLLGQAEPLAVSRRLAIHLRHRLKAFRGT